MTRQRFFGFAAVAGWLLLAGPLPAPNCGSGCGLGRFGVAAGDTIRLNVFMSPEGPPSAPARSCTVKMAIVNPPAALCTDCTPALLAGPTTITLGSGQVTGLEYPAGGAMQVLPFVSPEGPPNDDCRLLRSSVEVYDSASLRTRFLGAGRRLSPEGPPVTPAVPDGPPSFPHAGLTASDTLRITWFYSPEGPPQTPASACTVRSAVQGVSVDGFPTMLASNSVMLMPGQTATLSYSDPTISSRKLVVPRLQPEGPPTACRQVVPTVELVDSSSGRTSVLLPEGPPN